MKTLTLLLLSAVLLFGSATYQFKDLYKTEDGLLTDKKLKPITGLIFTYYKTGEFRATIEYKNGVRHGMTIMHRKDASKFAESMYFNGLEEGISKSYHVNGVPSIITSYIKGVVVGTEHYFDKNGKKTFEIKYKNGKIKSGLQYTASGKVLIMTDRDLVPFN